MKWKLNLILLFVVVLVIAFVNYKKSVEQNNLAFRSTNDAIYKQIDAQYNHQYVEAAGVNWHFVDEGNPNGEVILLMHGLPESFYSWSKVIPLLDQNYRIIALDLKGYGRSSSLDNNYEWHYVAKQTMALMDALQIEKFHIIGHDWGAIISSMMVGDYPERILSYVRMQADLFSESSVIKKYIHKPQFLFFQSETIASTVLSNATWLIDTVYNSKKYSQDQTKLSAEDRIYLIYEFSRPDVAKSSSKYFLSKNSDFNALFTKISENNFPFKVLQLQADSDPSQPNYMFSTIPQECANVQLKWIIKSGHFSPFDQPEQVAKAINEFIKQ